MKRFLSIFALVFAFTVAAQAQRQYTLGVVSASDGYVNVRTGPGTNYGIVTSYRNGTTLYYGAGSGRWYRVYRNAYGGFLGYVHNSGLRAKSTRTYGPGMNVGRIYDPDGYVNIRSAANGSSAIRGRLYNGDRIQYTRASGNWVRAYDMNGRYLGYVHGGRVR